MNRYKLLGKTTNSFGDLIVHLIDNRTSKPVQMVFEENSWWQLDVILGERIVN